MKLFKFYSTAEKKKNADMIIDLSFMKFHLIRFYFDEDDQCFIVNLETDKASLKELHQDVNVAKERAKLMLMQFDIPEADAEIYAKEARFLIQ